MAGPASGYVEETASASRPGVGVRAFPSWLAFLDRRHFPDRRIRVCLEHKLLNGPPQDFPGPVSFG